MTVPSIAIIKPPWFIFGMFAAGVVVVVTGDVVADRSEIEDVALEADVVKRGVDCCCWSKMDAVAAIVVEVSLKTLDVSLVTVRFSISLVSSSKLRCSSFIIFSRSSSSSLLFVAQEESEIEIRY